MKGVQEFDLSEIGTVANLLITESGDTRIWLFSGDPGAGKTTLIRALTGLLGADSSSVSSPTFALLNDYPAAAGTIHHFDLYRVRALAELYDIGMDEYLDSGEYCLVEWPDKLGNLAPSRYFSVSLEITGPQTRKITYATHD